MIQDKINEISKNPELIYSVAPRVFEEIVAELLSSFGWQIKLSPPTRDGGFDILGITTDGSGLEASWIVECKRYAENKKVGVDLVRQLYGAKNYLGVSNAVLVTTSSFTDVSESFSKLKYDIKLVDRLWLMNWINKYVPTSENKQHFQENVFQSCFISHSQKDYGFAEYLTLKLRENGIKTWFAPDDMPAGKKLHEEIYNAISIFDKLIIVLSENSINSEWVKSEIRRARKREIQENKRILFPVSLVPMEILREWECFDADSGKDLAVEIREYYIPILNEWEKPSNFEQQFKKILAGLVKK